MIRVNGIELDFDERTPVSFDISFMDIRQLGNLTAEGIVSVSLRLPRTQRNHLALGHYSSLTERNNTFKYTYEVNGNQVLNGRMMILSRSREEVTALLTAKAADWIEAVKVLGTRDVDLGSRLFGPAEFVAATEDSSVVAYPFFQFTADQFQEFPAVNVNNFKPAPNIGNFLRQMFDSVGYDLELIGAMSELDAMHILRGTATDADILFEDAETLLDAAAGIGATFRVYLNTLGVFTDFMIPAVTHQIILDEGDNITYVDYEHATAPPGNPEQQVLTRPFPVYTSSVGAAYRIELDIRYRLRSFSNLAISGDQISAQTPISVVAKVIEMPFPGSEILVPPAANPTQYNTLSEFSFQFTGHIGNFLNPIPVDNTINLPEFVVAAGVQFAVVLYFPTVSGSMANVWLECFRSSIKIETAPTLVSNGLTYNVQDAMPTMKAGEFLKSIIQNFNGIVDTEFNTVKIHCRDEWYLDESDDWTAKTDTEQPIEHITITDIGKLLKFDYLTDNDDKLQERFRIANNKEFGGVEIEMADDILFGETEVTSSVRWAASIERTGFGSVNIPQGVRRDDTGSDDNSPFFNDYRAEDRILYDKGKAGLEFQVITEPETQPPLSVNAYRNLSFEPLNFSNVYDRFWRRTIDLINSGELVRVWLRLTAADMAQLNYRTAKLITLDDGNVVKAWINRITDLRPGSGRSTQVEFIVKNNKGEFQRPNVRPAGRAYDEGYSDGYN